MKQIIFTLAIMVVCSSVAVSSPYGGGSGTQEYPYQIWTPEQMNQIGLNQGDWGKHFKLMADIDLGYYDGLDGRPKFNCIGKGSPYGHTGFTGSFDGNGKTIRNFTYSTYKSYGVSIFAYLDGPTGKIQDLIIESPLVNYIGHGYCGALVGRAEGGIIRNCHVIGGSILWGSYVGALVGDNWADVYNCSASTSVTGAERVGGLVGRNFGRIYESFASGPVSGTRLVGGMAGINSDAFSSHGMIENSYSTSDVTGQYAGGLVGQQWGGSVVNSYSTGTVSGSSSIGGLIGGIVVGGYASNSFWDTSTSLIEISADGTGLPTEQMQDIDTFLNAGWDFVGESTNGTDDIWRMPESSYPLLAWQITISPPVANANGPYSIFVGDTLTLDASGSTDDDNDIASYLWDLDDDGGFETDAGSQAIFDVNFAYLQSLGLLINHTYNIHVKVTDSIGQSDTADSTLTITPQPAVKVAVDIKSGSCPNPLNVKSKGVLPVAILGSEELDVNSIDIASIRLAGVAPIRSSFEDVAAPVSDANECECSKEGPDGFLDLTLKFEIQMLVEAIGEVEHGDELVLELTSVLSDDTPIEGSDCIIIRGKHKPLNRADFNGDGIVDMADFAALSENWLQSSVVED